MVERTCQSCEFQIVYWAQLQKTCCIAKASGDGDGDGESPPVVPCQLKPPGMSRLVNETSRLFSTRLTFSPESSSMFDCFWEGPSENGPF